VDRRNTGLLEQTYMLIEGFSGCLPIKGLAGPAVEHVGNCVDLVSVPAREVSTLGEVLTQESVGVLIAADDGSPPRM
jgi:hypothetical protein